MPDTAFWFLRHGQTDYNARFLSQGGLDISLNETGRAQARAAAAALAGQGITALFSSPMQRARETAEIVNAALRLPVIFEPDLREVIFGIMEGQPMQPWFAAWLAGSATPAGAETFAALRARTAAIFPKILDTPGPVLIVAHGGVFRALRDIMALPRDWPTPNAVPLYCRLAAGGWQITEGKLEPAG